MQYLESFTFPTDGQEFDFMLTIKRKCYETFYPFKILSAKGLHKIGFEPITILYGDNGCGKTTALNVIAEKIGIEREAVYNRSNFFEDYTKMCKFELDRQIPKESKIVTSDDVFDYMLNIRTLNLGLDGKREELFDEYTEAKNAKFQMKSMEDYDELKKINLARKRTQSMFVKDQLMNTIITKSNGESAFIYFTTNIKKNALYLLDEPENSLSPERQMELVQFIEDSVRFYGCQFIISTHSPFLLAMKHAKVYDMDDYPIKVKKWTELKNVRLFHEFFKEHDSKF